MLSGLKRHVNATDLYTMLACVITMEKVYMVCDWFEGKVYGGAMNVGIEYMGDCSGRILKEDGTEIGRHHSSTFGWLRNDLRAKLDDPSKYEIIDLIEQEVPDKFKLANAR